MLCDALYLHVQNKGLGVFFRSKRPKKGPFCAVFGRFRAFFVFLSFFVDFRLFSSISAVFHQILPFCLFFALFRLISSISPVFCRFSRQRLVLFHFGLFWSIFVVLFHFCHFVPFCAIFLFSGSFVPFYGIVSFCSIFAYILSFSAVFHQFSSPTRPATCTGARLCTRPCTRPYTCPYTRLYAYLRTYACLCLCTRAFCSILSGFGPLFAFFTLSLFPRSPSPLFHFFHVITFTLAVFSPYGVLLRMCHKPYLPLYSMPSPGFAL